MIVNVKNNNKYFERTETLVKYFNDIKDFNNGLSIEDERKFFKLYKNGTKKEKEYARKILIESNQKFVISVARVYANNNNLMDIIDEGNVGLIKAIDAFDEEYKVNGKHVKFISFAVHYIRREINEYKINVDSIIKKHNIARTYHIISQARSKFLQDNGRQPTSEELRELMNKEYGLNIKHNSDVLDLKITHIDETSSDDEKDANIGALFAFNSYSSTSNGYENIENGDYYKTKVASLLNVLTPREKKVIKLAFGIGEYRELTNEEIGERMGLTPERIRQMRSSIMIRLKNEFKKKVNDGI